jgi:hypothetical protein
MKLADLQVGMWVAVRDGPSSKNCFKALVLDLGKWCEGKQGHDYVPFKDPMALSDVTGIALAAGRTRFMGISEKDCWYPRISQPGLIVEPWESYEARVEAARKQRISRQQDEEQAYDAARARRESISKRLNLTDVGFFSPHKFDRVVVTLAELEVLADRLEARDEQAIGKRVQAATQEASDPARDPLFKSLPPEELAKVERPTVEEIQAAIEKGQADRARAEPFVRPGRRR